VEESTKQSHVGGCPWRRGYLKLSFFSHPSSLFELADCVLRKIRPVTSRELHGNRKKYLSIDEMTYAKTGFVWGLTMVIVTMAMVIAKHRPQRFIWIPRSSESEVLVYFGGKASLYCILIDCWKKSRGWNGLWKRLKKQYAKMYLHNRTSALQAYDFFVCKTRKSFRVHPFIRDLFAFHDSVNNNSSLGFNWHVCSTPDPEVLHVDAIRSDAVHNVPAICDVCVLDDQQCVLLHSNANIPDVPSAEVSGFSWGPHGFVRKCLFLE